MARVRVDGKQFAVDERRFNFHGVSYGTFRPRPEDGARFPELDRVKRDFSAMQQAGFTVVRTYTTPPEYVIDLAADWDLRLLAGAYFPDWRYLFGASRRQWRRLASDARAEARAIARRLAGREEILGLALGNEVPADVVRWVGAKRVAAGIAELAEVVREEDPDMLVTYGSYPTAEYLSLDSLDFCTVNVFLERRADFRRYLNRLHNLAGDRPLVIGEMGLDAGSGGTGEARQAETLEWMREVALERGAAGTCMFSWTDEWWVGDAPVEGWHFGLTTADRTPRPALSVAKRWNSRKVADLMDAWPSMSLVVCAYNAAATLDECLAHACALDYPGLEIIVVDDGSDDDTAKIAGRHPRAQVLSISHAGLSVARNEGLRAACGDLVAYLDADAHPTPEWPYYLALGMDGPTVGGVGGPNLPPAGDGIGAQMVARGPGGPVHVLSGDNRAEHVPGCNMAFWKGVLEEVGGFDPVYTAAGDDVDLCWKVLDRGWDIAFHPAALIWHHRRTGLSSYLRQQRGYGRAEALVQARHPDRFTPLGTARWRGRIYNSLSPPPGRQRIYRGLYGTASYQSVYHAAGHGLDIAHQMGVPLAVAVALTAPLAALAPRLGLPAVAAVLFLAALAAADVAVASPPHRMARGRFRFKCGVAALHILQPLVRGWGRIRHRYEAQRDLPALEPLPGPPRRVSRTVCCLPSDQPRAEVASSVIAHLRRSGMRVIPATAWEDHDARLSASWLIKAELITSSYPQGCVQVWVRRRPRWVRIALGATLSVAAAGWSLAVPVVLAGAALKSLGFGAWRSEAAVRRLLVAGDPRDEAGKPREVT
ncbi:MAG: glycosyltransferase [Acidimicrobiia bacterium]